MLCKCIAYGARYSERNVVSAELSEWLARPVVLRNRGTVTCDAFEFLNHEARSQQWRQVKFEGVRVFEEKNMWSTPSRRIETFL